VFAWTPDSCRRTISTNGSVAHDRGPRVRYEQDDRPLNLSVGRSRGHTHVQLVRFSVVNVDLRGEMRTLRRPDRNDVTADADMKDQLAWFGAEPLLTVNRHDGVRRLEANR
jgi:hypothetical protein